MAKYDERTQSYRSDSRTSDELLSLAIRYAADVDASDDLFWNPVTVLQHRLEDIFPLICLQAKSPNLCERTVAATVLGQNGVKEKVLLGKCAALLSEMLSSEQQITVLTSILYALGHLKEMESIDSILPFVTHSNLNVRHAVTSALGGLENPRAINALIVLSRDADRDVRNWATFDLGTLTTCDTPEVREALVERLAETDAEIREEALIGLIERGDSRAIEMMLKELDLWDENQPEALPLMGQAIATLLRHSDGLNEAWTPVLEKIKKLKLGDEEE